MKKLSLPPTERRRLTRNQIYQYIYKAPGCSKQEIADSLNFSMPTVHQNLNELTQAGLVRIDGVGESTGGRRPLQLTINENAHFSVGISVTDDHFRIIAANLRLDEIAHQKYPHPHCNNMKEMGNFLAADLENFLRQHRTIPALRLKHRSGSCRTSLAVSALRIMRYCPKQIWSEPRKPAGGRNRATSHF